jgi:peptide/nickel transport system substrate-binding protein
MVEEPSAPGTNDGCRNYKGVTVHKALRRRGPVVATIGILTTAVLALTGCTSSGSTTAGEAKDYAELDLAFSVDPGSWNPGLKSSASDAVWHWHAVYDTLLRCQADGSVVPNAAESFELSTDATALTMKLRDGMTFSDGTPVDSAAAKASIENMQTAGGSDASRVASAVVTTPDDLTVVVTLPEAQGLLPTFMCLAPGALASPAALSGPDLDTVPISSGPYTLDAASTTSGSVYTFLKRDDYWNAKEFPYEKVVMTVMPDVNARLNALKTGQIDGAVVNQQTKAEAKGANLNVLELQANWAGLVIGDRNGTVVPALGDVQVRKAITMVFDNKAIAAGLFQGDATPTHQIFGPSTEAYIKGAKGPDFDVDAAKKLMADAGFADGFDVEIPALTGLGITDTANPLIIQQLALLNIRVTEVPLSGPTLIADLLSGRFPLMYMTLGTSSGLWDITQDIEPDSIWNFNRASDPKLQALLDVVQTQTGDEQKATLQEINQFLIDNAWFAPWVYPTNYFATANADTVTGSSDYFKNVANLWDFQ